MMFWSKLIKNRFLISVIIAVICSDDLFPMEVETENLTYDVLYPPLLEWMSVFKTLISRLLIYLK